MAFLADFLDLSQLAGGVIESYLFVMTYNTFLGCYLVVSSAMSYNITLKALKIAVTFAQNGPKCHFWGIFVT